MQGKSKHTPGPHRVEDREERLLIWADGSHDFIAELSTVADGVDDQEAQDAYAEEQRANADLYAAAWDMYEALRIRLAIDDDMCQRGSMPSDEREARLKDADRLMRAAKAKAEGSR